MATQARQDYIDQYAEAAMEQMRLTGIPASVILAQGCIESADGTSRLSRTANNHFGVKGTFNGQYVLADDDKPNEQFRQYADVSQSYTDHSRILVQGSRYSSLFLLEAGDYKGWSQGLQAAGYATNQNYGKALIQTIEANDLQKYDQMVIAQLQKEGRTLPTREEAKFNIQATLGAGSAARTNVAEDGPVQKYATGYDLPEGEYSMPIKRNNFLLMTEGFGVVDDLHPKGHKGIDIQARNENLYATESGGKVVSTQPSREGGNTIKIEYDRGNGVKEQISFMHLNSINVSVGDVVTAGQVIGLTGNTGANTTGPHLDMKVLRIAEKEDGTVEKMYVNPLAYLAEINARGNLEMEIRDRKSEAQFAQYQVIQKEQHQEQQQAQAQQESKKEQPESYSPADWFNALLTNGNSAYENQGYYQGGSGGLISTLVEFLLTLILFKNATKNLTPAEQREQITDAVINKTVDLTEYVRGAKSASIKLNARNVPVLTIDNGTSELSRELSSAEQARISQILNDSSLSQEQKTTRLGNTLNMLGVSMQAGQNYEQIVSQSQQQEQQQTVHY